MNANATTKRNGRADSAGLRLSLLTAAVLSAYSPLGQANPDGMAVIQGQASAARDGTTLTITNAPGSILHWQSFSIDAGETTRFVQQDASSAVLNRVVGQDPSAILGTLSSNGRVFLLNPNGILFGRDARVDVAGLVASTLNLSDQDFLAGRISLTDTGTAGAIRIEGAIRSSHGGSVYLVAPTVVNAGSIETPGGETVLAAGRAVRLGDTGAPGVLVELAADDARVTNLGTIEANGGAVNIYAGVIDQRGIVRAGSAQIDDSGRVRLVANHDVNLAAGSETSASGAAGGSIHIQAKDGTLMAEGTVAASGGQAAGGDVVLTGRQVGLTGSATVDVSGATGGGRILVGGDYQGGNAAVQNARAVFAGAGTMLRADATNVGDGGRVILWSDEATRSHGAISARGGGLGGDGGFVETSSKGYLEVNRTPDVTALLGQGGKWLLDPGDLTVTSITGTVDPSSPNFTATGAGSTVSAATINSALNSGTSVVLDTGIAATGGTGTLTVLAPIVKSTGPTASITLNADNRVVVSSDIRDESGAGLNISLNAARSVPTGDVVVDALVASGGGTIGIVAGSGGISGTGTLNSSRLNGNAGNISLTSGGHVLLSQISAAGTHPLNSIGAGFHAGNLTIDLVGTQPSRNVVVQTINLSGNAGSNGVQTGDPGGNGGAGGSFTINGGGRDVALSFTSVDISGGNAGTPFGGADGSGGHAGTMTVNNAGGLLSIEGDLLAAGGDSLNSSGATGSGPAGNGGVITINSGTIFVGIGPTDPPVNSSLQVDVTAGATTGTQAASGKLELVGGTGFEPFVGGGDNGGLAIDGLGNLEMIPGSLLVANATGSIILDGPGNVIENISGSSSAGNIEVFSTTTLKTGPLSAAGTIDLSVEGSGQQLITDGTLVAGGDITLTGNALGSLVQEVSTNGAVTTGGTLFINADEWEISGGTGNLQAASAIQWSTRGSAPLTLDMTGGVNRFVTPVLRFGSALTPIANDILLIDNPNLAGSNALTLPTTVGSMSLFTTGNVSQAVPLILQSGGGLQVTAASVSLADIGNRFGTLAGRATTGTFSAADSDGFALGTVDGISGLTLPANGSGTLFAATGDLVLGNGSLAAGQTGNWTLGAGPTGKVVVAGTNSAASVSSQTGTLLQLQGATLNLSGSGLINNGALNLAGSSMLAGTLVNNASVTTGTSTLNLQSLSQAVSTATLSGNLVVSGTAALSGGGLNSGASLVVLPTTGTLSLSGSVNINGTLTNQGNGTIAGTVTTNGGGKIANQGTLTLNGAQIAAHLDNQDIGPSVGTITVSGAPSNLTGLFSNAPNATITIAAGGTLNATGTSVNDGTIVNNGTLTTGGSFTSPGTLTNQGVFTVGSGTATLATLNNTGTAAGAGGALSVANYAASTGATVAGNYTALSLSNPGALAFGAGSYSASVSGALALNAGTSLTLGGISANAGSATLVAPTVLVSGAQVTSTGDMTVAAPGALTVDGSSGSAKLLAGGVMTVKAGSISVIGGTGGASIDPTALNLTATSDLTLTGGSAVGAKAEIFGDTVTVSAANISLTGGTAADTPARIASLAGDLSVVSGGALTLAMGASTDADAIMTAQGGSAIISAASCIGCTTLGSDPTGNGAIDGGAFATNGVLFSLANAQLVDNSVFFAADVASNSGKGTATNYTVGASTELAAEDGATEESDKDGEDGETNSTTDQNTASGEQNVGIPACN